MVVNRLGLMKAPFDELPNSMYDMIRQSIKRINNGNQEQELCSILHGLANMGAKWTRIPDLIRQEIVRLIADSGDIKALCIACTTYSLGMLECKWQELPDTVFDKLNTEVQRTKLVDQTLANTIYGLGLMDATWETMPNEFSAALLRMIFDPRSFDADVPQHITNTMWALGKMNFLWSFLPKTNLQEAFVRCAHQCNHQELANYFYGLSLMEASWSELSLETIQALEKQLKRNVDVLNSQEVANIMYAMPLLTFDFPFQQVANNPQEEAIRQGKLACMWTIHELLIKAYVPKHESSFSTENYDQFAAYFEWMSVLPGGYDLVMRYTDKYPIVSGPSATVPSRLHAHTVDALIDELQRSYSRKFEIFHEFSGLRGVFPIDSALYFDNELVALIEIDGDFHYQVGEQGEQQLRRKDFFKEALYKHWYPTLTTYRLKMDQITALGYTVAGTAAAHFIANDMMKHEKLVRDDHDQLCLADRNGINAAKAKATARKTTKPKSSEVSEEVASNVRKTKRSPKASIASDVEIEVMVDADSMSEPKKRGRKPKINT